MRVCVCGGYVRRKEGGGEGTGAIAIITITPALSLAELLHAALRC